MKAHLPLVCFLMLNIIMGFVWVVFDTSQGMFQFVVSVHTFDMHIHFGIDGISYFFLYLTTLLISLCLLYTTYSSKSENTIREHIILSTAIGLLLLIVFSVLDILIFYISFEAILIPFFIYIGISGYRSRRVHAAYLFFFYTLAGSFLMLLGIFYTYMHTGSTNVVVLWNAEYTGDAAYLLWLAFFTAFAVKIPMFPFHIWLPEAHVEAPTEGSVILAGLLLKLGTYGILRFLLPTLPEVSEYMAPIVIMQASVGIIYTSMSTLRQLDIKRVIAYSSIAHMNMCVLGLFSMNEVAFSGSLFLMITHGIVSGGLFFVVGSLYERFKTKTIFYFSGVVHSMPLLSFPFFILILGNIGMPGTCNFVGEFLILTGIICQLDCIATLGAICGIFLCTVYSMWLYNKIVFMLPRQSVWTQDLYIHEITILIVLIIWTIFLGICPNSVFSISDFAIHYHYFDFFNNDLIFI
jgi:NADH-quinone oxidoreductase subunit M